MPLVKCRECEKEVSSDAQKCPYCGVKNPCQKKASRSFWIKVVLFLGLLGGLGYGYTLYTEKDTIKEKAKEFTKEEKEAFFKTQSEEIKADSKDLIIEMLKEGKKISEISKATGVKRSEIRKLRRALRKEQKEGVDEKDEEEE